MAAGDLVVADWQYELRTTLMGDGSDFPIDRARRSSFTPLGSVSVKSRDVDLVSGEGMYAGTDRLGSRTFTLPLFYEGTTANCGLAIQTMETAWAASATDIVFYGRIPGVGKFHISGRPRNLTVDFADMDFGVIRFLGVFVAPDPTYTED